LLKNLAKVTQKSKPQRGFYFVVEPGGRAIVSCEPVSKRGGDDSMRPSGGSLSTGGALGLEAPPGGGFGVGGGTAGLGARTIDTRIGGDIDPVTGEPTGNDWAFEIVFQVVLAPPEEGSAAAPH
jgi:hypothetical protein